MPEHFIIIGGGQAAAQAVQTLRQNRFDGRVTIVGEEQPLPYQRPPLSKKYLAGKLTAERLAFRPEKYYEDGNVTLELGVRAELIEPSAQRLQLGDGRELDGIHYVRTIADADAIRAELLPGKRLVIVGAGYIGLEVASIAAGLGVGVTVLEAADRVMTRVVCPEIAAFYHDYHSNAGVKLYYGTSITAFRGQDRVDEVETIAGQRFECDLVVAGIGIEPQVELAKAAGLYCDDGIHVDDYARTADPHIVAAGDCVNRLCPFTGRRIRLESVHNAVEQAKTAALSLLGESHAYAQVPWFWSDQFDLKLQIAGLSGDHDRVVVRGNPDDASFSAFYLRSGKLIAVDAVNSPRDFMAGKQLIAAETVVDVGQLADSTTTLFDLI